MYQNTKVQYYAEAVDAFAAMKEDLEKAESFIFMEYFIVEDSSSFRELQEILLRKHSQGVEVRLLYDDIGSVGYVNLGFAKRMNDAGVLCACNALLSLCIIFGQPSAHLSGGIYETASPILWIYLFHCDDPDPVCYRLWHCGLR